MSKTISKETAYLLFSIYPILQRELSDTRRIRPVAEALALAISTNLCILSKIHTMSKTISKETAYLLFSIYPILQRELSDTRRIRPVAEALALAISTNLCILSKIHTMSKTISKETAYLLFSIYPILQRELSDTRRIRPVSEALALAILQDVVLPNTSDAVDQVNWLSMIDELKTEQP